MKKNNNNKPSRIQEIAKIYLELETGLTLEEAVELAKIEIKHKKDVYANWDKIKKELKI